jgi:hypothetical protein
MTNEEMFNELLHIHEYCTNVAEQIADLGDDEGADKWFDVAGAMTLARVMIEMNESDASVAS